MARKTYYVEVAGSKLAWTAEENKYKNIAGELGVKLANNSTTGLVFGVNSPRLPRIRLNFEKTGAAGASASPTTGVTVNLAVGGGRPGSQIVFCAPDKVKGVTFDRKLAGKTSNGKKIKSCSMIGVRT